MLEGHERDKAQVENEHVLKDQGPQQGPRDADPLGRRGLCKLFPMVSPEEGSSLLRKAVGDLGRTRAPRGCRRSSGPGSGS